MTVQIIQNISNWQEVADYTRNLLEACAPPSGGRVGTAEQAFSALGRQQLWLRYEPDYQNGTYCDGIDDPRLWNFLKRLVPTADLAQVFGGNRGISFHRDAAYANSTAFLLSLGKSTFEIEARSGKLYSIDLVGGELLTFDCKCRHRAINVDPQRIGIGLWSAKIPLPIP